MKKLIFNFLISVVFLFAVADAQSTAGLEWRLASGTTVSTDPIVSCVGTTPSVSFRVSYDNNPGGPCPPGLWMSNYYKFSVYLKKNSSVITSSEFEVPSCRFTGSWSYPIDAAPGDYFSAEVRVARRRTFYSYQYIENKITNTITASTTPAVPAFDINGMNVDTPVTVNVKYPIVLNAAATTCETNYNVTVEESDSSGNKTLEYEWSKWFPGTAINGLNLQQLATTYGYSPNYSGTDLTRQGTLLIGGNLLSGTPRWYRVSVCTQQPTLNCKLAMLRVEY